MISMGTQVTPRLQEPVPPLHLPVRGETGERQAISVSSSPMGTPRFERVPEAAAAPSNEGRTAAFHEPATAPSNEGRTAAFHAPAGAPSNEGRPVAPEAPSNEGRPPVAPGASRLEGPPSAVEAERVLLQQISDSFRDILTDMLGKGKGAAKPAAVMTAPAPAPTSAPASVRSSPRGYIPHYEHPEASSSAQFGGAHAARPLPQNVTEVAMMPPPASAYALGHVETGETPQAQARAPAPAEHPRMGLQEQRAGGIAYQGDPSSTREKVHDPGFGGGKSWQAGGRTNGGKGKGEWFPSIGKGGKGQWFSVRGK